MSAETEKVTSYPLSDVPEFILKGKKGDVSVQELEYQCQKLRDENHQLQLRILGVNELARLLQDRNEAVALLKDRNKRLEMSLVRLETRCANFERQIKSQKSSSVASVKPGQSPFIPGPSRQILEGLMQENIELKKTVNSLQKKGSSGYLEAVKTTQLEEFIDQQKQEIDQLRGQINSLTSSGEEESAMSGGGGGMSLPANVTESGPLRRQVIKMQQTMAVKDRFCSLLSQQVTELQKKLASVQSDKTTTMTDSEENVSGKPISETGGPGEAEMDTPHKTQEELASYKKQLDELKSTYDSSVAKMTSLEENVKSLTRDKEALEEKYEGTSQVYSTLLMEKSELQRELDSLRSQGGASGGGVSSVDGEGMERLRSQNKELQNIMDEQVNNYTMELKSKNSELSMMRIELEESNMKFMETDSLLTQCRNDLKQLKETVVDLEDQNDFYKNKTMELNTELRNKDFEIKTLKAYKNPISSLPTKLRTGGWDAPQLITGVSAGPEVMAKDNVHYSTSMLKSRGDPNPTVPNPSSPGGQQQQQQQPPTHSKPTALALQQRPEHLPPGSSHRSPVPQTRGGVSGHTHPPSGALQTPVTPHTSAGVMGGLGGMRPYSSISSPAPMGPQQFTSTGQGFAHRSGSTGSVPNRYPQTQPQPLNSSYSGTGSPRLGTPGNSVGGGVPSHTMMGGPNVGSSTHSVGYALSGMSVNRFTTGSGLPPSSSTAPPPLPPRSQQGGYQQYGQPLFGVHPSTSYAPRPSQQQYPHYMQHQGQGSGGNTTGGYPQEMREQQRPSGSTSPHPDPPNMHPPYGGPGGSGNNGPPPPGSPFH